MRSLLFKYSAALFFFIFFSPFFLSTAHSHTEGDHSVIRVGIFPLEPLNYIDANGEAQGLYPDLIRQIGNEENWEVEFVPGSWSSNLEALQTEKIDLMTTVAYSIERDKVMEYNKEPVIDIWGQIFILPGSGVSNILDLNGLKVAIMRKDINGRNFIKTAEEFGIQCRIIELATHDDVFFAVKNGDVEAGVAPQHFGLRHSKEYGIVASSIQFSPFSTYFTVKKGQHHELIQHIDSYLTRWKQNKDSYYYERLSYWLGGKEFQRTAIPRWLIVTFLCIAGIAFCLLVLNRALNIKVKQRTKELYSREKEYRELVESANSIILRWDIGGRILFLNKYALNLFGYSQEEIIGRHVIGTIVPKEETTGRDLHLMIDDILKSPEKYSLNENENICKDGRRIFIQWTNKAILDEDGKLTEILSIGTDITERKKLEVDLAQSRKMEAIGTLAGGIAHDFNNVLAIIFGYTELAQMDKNNPEKVSKDVDQIYVAATRAKDLVSQILTFSRKKDFEKESLQLSVIVKEVIKMLRSTFPVNISIEENIKTESRVFLDPSQIHQVMMNLCTNAFHSMESTGGTLGISLKEISISDEKIYSADLNLEPGAYIQLEISDTGSGISKENMQKIFDPYFTTKELGRGTGLGLAVVHGIVEEHKGHIKLYSAEGEGTTVHLYFPKVEIDDETVERLEADEPLQGGNEKVILIDDEPGIIASESSLLSEYGYQVTSFTDAQEAFKVFKDNPDAWNIVITDMTMPQMTGSQLAQEIFKLRPNFPIVLCTGFSKLINKDTSEGMGIAAYLQKPVEKTDLLRTIRQVLDKGSANN